MPLNTVTIAKFKNATEKLARYLWLLPSVVSDPSLSSSVLSSHRTCTYAMQESGINTTFLYVFTQNTHAV